MVDNSKDHADAFDEIGLTSWYFSKVVKDTINKVTGLEVLEEKYISESNNTFNNQISSIVILTGEKNLMISISMSFKTATILVAYMTDIPQAEIKLEEQSDGIDEIANMIAGQTKAKLASVGHHYIYMQPFTIVGDNHHILQKSKVSSLNLKFHTGAIEILMSVSIQ